jgi:hypothetical protein
VGKETRGVFAVKYNQDKDIAFIDKVVLDLIV